MESEAYQINDFKAFCWEDLNTQVSDPEAT